MSSENTGWKQSGRFQKGKSGNPGGRPRGSRNLATLACEALLDGQAERLTQKAIELALAGDVVALRLCMERIYPPRKGHPVSFAVPTISSARDAADLSVAILEAVAAGRLTPVEATELSKVVAGTVKAFEVADAGDQARIVSLTDAELYQIIHQAAETAPLSGRVPSLPVGPQR